MVLRRAHRVRKRLARPCHEEVVRARRVALGLELGPFVRQHTERVRVVDVDYDPYVVPRRAADERCFERRLDRQEARDVGRLFGVQRHGGADVARRVRGRRAVDVHAVARPRTALALAVAVAKDVHVQGRRPCAGRGRPPRARLGLERGVGTLAEGGGVRARGLGAPPFKVVELVAVRLAAAERRRLGGRRASAFGRHGVGPLARGGRRRWRTGRHQCCVHTSPTILELPFFTKIK